MTKKRRKYQKHQRRLPQWVEVRLKVLRRELRGGSPDSRRAAREAISDLLKTFVGKPKRQSRVPLPKSYIDERRASREAARKLSGRGWVRLVQGGAPGSGRR